MALLDSSHTPFSIAFLFIGIIIWAFANHARFHKRYRFPTMVPGLPIVGNSFQMPSTEQGPFVQKLAEKYGEMFTMKFGNSYWVFLNSRRVANELLDKRAAIYSSRQNLAMAHELVSGGKRILVMPYGDLWRRERKIMHQILNVNQSGIFEPFQDIESKALLYQYLETPETWWLSNARFSNSVVMSVVFGRRSEMNDPDLAELLSTSEQFVQFLMPGRAIVDLLPVLTKIPWFKSLQPWRWYGDALYRRTLRVYKKQMDDLRQRQRDGKQSPCFMTEFLKMGKDKEFTDEELYFIPGTLMEAGSDTTRVSIYETIAGAALFPDWVQRARKDLDAVCGENAQRLPEFSDMDRLPIMKAIVKESIRWKPAIAETGIPHALIKDDEFEGYRFPAGTVFTYNHWAISNSSAEYKDPERFWPERFLDDDVDKPTKGHLGFGAGRRLCVGYTVAVNNLLIVLSRLIYCFDFHQVPGKPIDTSKSFIGPVKDAPFSIRITPRSEAHRELVERECKEAPIIR